MSSMYNSRTDCSDIICYLKVYDKYLIVKIPATFQPKICYKCEILLANLSKNNNKKMTGGL